MNPKKVEEISKCGKNNQGKCYLKVEVRMFGKQADKLIFNNRKGKQSNELCLVLIYPEIID